MATTFKEAFDYYKNQKNYETKINELIEKIYDHIEKNKETWIQEIMTGKNVDKYRFLFCNIGDLILDPVFIETLNNKLAFLDKEKTYGARVFGLRNGLDLKIGYDLAL